MNDFVSLGPAGAVAEGGMKAFVAGTHRVAVARTGGKLYAFDNVCTHAYCPLSDGELEGTTVVCPCHLGQFDVVTGEVVAGLPPEPIAVYPVREVDGELQVAV